MRRITILKLAKQLLMNNVVDYMCGGLKVALQSKGLAWRNVDLKRMFPEFNITVAREKFNASIKTESFEDPWWRYDNKKDRIAYFDYLIEFYKDDKTDIKKEFKQWLD